MVTNACSIRNKWMELYTVACERRATVLAVTETWLKEHDVTPGIILDRFSVHRNDRSVIPGGGVAILIRKDITHLKLEVDVDLNNVQLCAITIILPETKVTIACIYRSPGSTDLEDQELIAALDLLVQRSGKLYIVGDFNLPDINWVTGSCIQGNVGDNYIRWMNARALYQHVTFDTRFRNGQMPSLLDLIISKSEQDVTSLTSHPPIGKSDHLLIEAEIRIKPPKRKVKMTRNFGRMDINNLRSRALGLNWQLRETSVEVEGLWANIKQNLLNLQDEFAPLKYRGHKGKPPWWRAAVTRAIKRRDRSWRSFQKAGSQIAWVRYAQLRNTAVSLIREKKRTYEIKLSTQIRQKPKKYYSYVQSKGTTREEMGPLITNENLVLTENRDKVEAFCTYFSSVQKVDTGDLPRAHTSSVKYIDGLDVSEEQVLKILNGLQTSKSPGPDGIHPAIIKPIADIIVTPICKLYQMSLDQGVLPVDWKTAAVIARHKGGNKADVKNYRPISLTSILCKGLEKIVKSHVVKHLEEYHLMSKTQHGFVKQRSCLTNLLCFLEEVTSKLDEGKKIEVCYLDFSKAFDSVNHRLLKSKLEHFGIQGQLQNWISAFLSHRSFYVRVGEECSTPVQLTSGVPQGSVLGPLLFLLYINDLPNTLTSSCYIFADDVKVVGSNGRKELERDLNEVAKWANEWSLCLNANKSHVLTGSDNSLEVKIEDKQLSIVPVKQVRDLGILVTDKLTWANQCALAASKGRRELFRLRSVLSCKKQKYLLHTTKR